MKGSDLRFVELSIALTDAYVTTSTMPLNTATPSTMRTNEVPVSCTSLLVSKEKLFTAAFAWTKEFWSDDMTCL